MDHTTKCVRLILLFFMIMEKLRSLLSELRYAITKLEWTTIPNVPDNLQQFLHVYLWYSNQTLTKKVFILGCTSTTIGKIGQLTAKQIYHYRKLLSKLFNQTVILLGILSKPVFMERCPIKSKELDDWLIIYFMHVTL